MSAEWAVKKVADIASGARNALVGGPFGSNLVARDYVEEGVPVIRGQNMAGRWVGGDFAYVTREKAQSLEANLARPADIVFTQRGTLGQVALVPERPFETYLISQSQMKLTLDRESAEPLFFYYQFLSPTQQEYIRQHSIQVGVPHTNLGILRETPVVVPPILEQRAIAHMLGSLDDKIELNRRMNETLEAITRAIFKSWFVDFDPVRAKVNGEPPESICRRLGLTRDLLALFADRFVDSELGEIPEGWDVKPLDEIANYLNGLALQKFPPKSEYEWLPVIKIAQLKSGNTVGADRASNKINRDYVVEDGDVLFSWSGSLEVDVWCGGRGALNQHLFKVTSPRYPKWFFFHWTVQHLAHFRTIAAGKAVTMGHIQRRHLTEAACAVPPAELLDQADSVIAAMFQYQIENRKQSRTLSIIRDAILPKLLSGEIRVPLEGVR